MNIKSTLFKAAAVLLALLTVAPTMSACSSGADTAKTSDTTASVTAAATDAVSEEDTRIYPDLPEENYNGYTFNVLHWDRSDWPTRACVDIYAETETGDTINDAVYRRNMAVMEKYDFEITLQKEQPGDLTTLAKKNVQTGSDAYDLIIQRCIEGAAIIQENYYLPLNEVPNIDLDQPWYDQNARETLEIKGKLFIAASDLTIEDKNATAAIAFNKQMAADNNLEDMYRLVNDGKWTIEKMEAMYKGVARDLDGNSEMNEEDLYGFLGGKDVGMSLFLGSGAHFMGVDNDGYVIPTMINDRNVQVAQYVYEICTNEDIFYHHHNMGTDDTQYEQLFTNGHGLYFWMRLDNVLSMRASEVAFGILPIPKYDEAQETYLCNVSPWTTGLLAIPTTATDPSRNGLIIEALSAESKYVLQPAYYEIALKEKQTRDEESKEMLELIFNNRVFDIAEFYRIGTLSDVILEMGSAKSFDVASRYEKLSKATIKAIDKFMGNFES